MSWKGDVAMEKMEGRGKSVEIRGDEWEEKSTERQVKVDRKVEGEARGSMDVKRDRAWYSDQKSNGRGEKMVKARRIAQR